MRREGGRITLHPLRKGKLAKKAGEAGRPSVRPDQPPKSGGEASAAAAFG